MFLRRPALLPRPPIWPTKLNDKCQLHLLKDFKRSAIRDFRIQTEKLHEVLQAMEDDEDGLPAAAKGKGRKRAAGGEGRARASKKARKEDSDNDANDDDQGDDDE